MKKGFWVKRVAGFIVMGLAALFLFTWLVMGLWNAILVPVLAVKAVSFWQAAGILLLSKILFGGFGAGRGCGGGGRHWKQGIRDRWANMSDEEKIRMKQEWKQRCSHWKGGNYDNNSAGSTVNQNKETE